MFEDDARPHEDQDDPSGHFHPWPNREPRLAPSFSPATDMAAVTMPMTTAGNQISTPIIARLKPTARASMLVAMLSMISDQPFEGSPAPGSSSPLRPDWIIRPPTMRQQREGDPVIDRGDGPGDGQADEPADNRHEELEQSEVEAQPEGGAAAVERPLAPAPAETTVASMARPTASSRTSIRSMWNRAQPPKASNCGMIGTNPTSAWPRPVTGARNGNPQFPQVPGPCRIADSGSANRP